jgi:hypothetical protein
MTKQNKLDDIMKSRAPFERQAVKPVNVLETNQKQQSERTHERSNERTNERSNARPRVRHSFDIYQDQLLSLKEIAIKREETQGKRVLLGDLVQEALDRFITHERANERTNG